MWEGDVKYSIKNLDSVKMSNKFWKSLLHTRVKLIPREENRTENVQSCHENNAETSNKQL